MPEFVFLTAGRRTACVLSWISWLSFATAVGPQAPPAGGATPEWRWSHPLPHGNNIADLVHRSGTYVQVTDHGGIYTSSDRAEWQRQASGTLRNLRGAAFLGARLLITGEEGTALWSDDGVRFETATVTPSTTDWFEGVAASASAAVAVGDNGTIYRSGDGRAWTRVSGTGFTDWLSGVAYGAGVFVAVGENGFVASSPDGNAWTRRTSGTTANLARVAFGDGRFLAVGAGGVARSSLTGSVWTAEPSTGTTNGLLAATVAPGERLAVGESAMVLRVGTGAWEDQLLDTVSPSPAPAWTYAASVWDGERYLVGGRTGVMVESFRTNAPGLSGLTFWFRLDESPRNWLWALERVAGTYIAVGDRGTILTSPTGGDWDLEAAPVTETTLLYGLGGSPSFALAAGNAGTLLRSPAGSQSVVVTNLIVAAGRTNVLLTTNKITLTGINWETTAVGLTTNTLQGIGWNGALYVVVGGNGTVLTSPDATQWNRGTIPGAGFLSSVAPTAGGWVATGAAGAIFTSPDAVVWTRQTPVTTNWVYRVRAFDGQWIGVGQNGLILTSTNGVGWTTRTSGTTAWLTDVARVGSAFYVCGTQGTVLRSTNLADWTALETLTGKALYGIASAGGQVVVAGAEGVILRAPAEAVPATIAAYARFADGSPPVEGFVLEGTSEQRVRIEGAPALGEWTTEAELRLGVEGRVSHGRAAPEPARFHRVATPP